MRCLTHSECRSLMISEWSFIVTLKQFGRLSVMTKQQYWEIVPSDIGHFLFMALSAYHVHMTLYLIIT